MSYGSKSKFFYCFFSFMFYERKPKFFHCLFFIHVSWEQTQVLSLSFLQFFSLTVDIVLLVDNIHILIDGVIVYPFE